MAITIKLETVDFTAQGVSGALDLTKLPAASLEYIMTYGARRVLQDSINSAAKKARDDGDDFDAQLFVDDKIAKLEAGEITQRGSGGGGVDAVMRMMMKVIRPTVKKSDAAKYKNADAGERDAMVTAYIEKLDENQLATLRAHAEKLIAIDAAKPKLNIDLSI